MQPPTDKPSDQTPAATPTEESTSHDATEALLDANDGETGDGTVKRAATFVAWYADTLVWGLFLAALAADQITKAIVTSNLSRGESWPDDGFFQFTYARNTGTAFGLFRDQGFALTIISLIAVAGMIYFFRGSALKNWPMRLAIGMMLGGAVGNLVDRIRLGFVVDFIDVGTWPIFNLADSFITSGIAVLVIATVLFPDKFTGSTAQNEPDSEQQEEPDGPEQPLAGEPPRPPDSRQDNPN